MTCNSMMCELVELRKMETSLCLVCCFKNKGIGYPARLKTKTILYNFTPPMYPLTQAKTR